MPLQIVVVAELLSWVAILILDGTLATGLHAICCHQFEASITLTAFGIRPRDEEGITTNALGWVVVEGTL